MKPKGGGSSEKPHSEIGRVIEPQSEEERAVPPTTGTAPSQRETRPQHQQQQEIAEQRHAHPQEQHPKIVSQHPPTVGGVGDDSPKPKAAISSQQHESSTSETTAHPRQVIAVSASKGPAAFFNLARKFLVTDKECDLSALEGAIVSAVDAAHLLERSKLAKIIRYAIVFLEKNLFFHVGKRVFLTPQSFFLHFQEFKLLMSPLSPSENLINRRRHPPQAQQQYRLKDD
jgi:hypothetical protein